MTRWAFGYLVQLLRRVVRRLIASSLVVVIFVVTATEDLVNQIADGGADPVLAGGVVALELTELTLSFVSFLAPPKLPSGLKTSTLIGAGASSVRPQGHLYRSRQGPCLRVRLEWGCLMLVISGSFCSPAGAFSGLII